MRNAGKGEGDSDREVAGFIDLTAMEWSEEVVELSHHLDRLWRVGGDEAMTVGEMHHVRAGLFGYGQIRP